MSTLQQCVLAAQVVAALFLVGYHYLLLHGWLARGTANYYGLPDPGLTRHAHWEKSWDRRTRLSVYGLGLASVLMLAAAWSCSPGLGLLVTAAAELAASFTMRRSLRRAARAEGQAHDHS